MEYTVPFVKPEPEIGNDEISFSTANIKLEFSFPQLPEQFTRRTDVGGSSQYAGFENVSLKVENNPKIKPERRSPAGSINEGEGGEVFSTDINVTPPDAKQEYSRNADQNNDLLRIQYSVLTNTTLATPIECIEKNSLKTHTTPASGETRFSCSRCTYICYRRRSLKTHIFTHTGEKPFSCSQCAFSCIRKSDLSNHVLTHTGEKPFSCIHCSYMCNKKSNLSRHMLTHTGNKPFSCSQCAYRFTLKGDLSNHMLIHTGEKPFSCSLCSYVCNRKYSLKKHMLIHSGEKSFSCTQCSYRCNRKASLSIHTLSHIG